MKRMDWPHLALACASLLTAGTAFAAREAPPILGILSLPVMLAAVAGSGLILSFLPRREISMLKLFGTIGFCAVLGMIGAAMAVRVAAKSIPEIAGPGAEVVGAFLVGAVSQWLVPLLIEHKGDLIGLVLRKKGGS